MFVAGTELEVGGIDGQQVGAAVSDIVGQQLDAVDAHQPEQGVVRALEVGCAVFVLYGGQFAAQDLHEEVAVATGRLGEARINALSLGFDHVEHGLDHPDRCEYFAVIGDTLFGFGEVHGGCVLLISKTIISNIQYFII